MSVERTVRMDPGGGRDGDVRSVGVGEELIDICEVKGRGILGAWPEVLNGYCN
jgi:hypothetical protein